MKTEQEQLERVIHMEQLCDRITEALDAYENVPERLMALQNEIRELTEYYESPLWMEDFDAERNGVFPKDIKRGILTEDTLYDLIGDVERIMREDETE